MTPRAGYGSTERLPADFMARLDPFLAALPEGFRYGVEIRNPEYLSPDYFALLTAHNVAHVFNAWTRMPVIEDQIQLPGAFTADFTVVRALLRKGRAYDQAVKAFEPYEGARDARDRGGVAEAEEAGLPVREQPA